MEMIRTGLRILLVGLAATLAGQAARAELISFATTPAGLTPIDNAVLDAPYLIPGGAARMFFDTNRDNQYTPGTDRLALFEAAGGKDAGNAFDSRYGKDTAAPGFESQLGSFFLRQAGGAPPAPFVVAFDTTRTISGLSGVIWDIDGVTAKQSEQWLVEVLDASGNVLASELSPLGTSITGSLNGRPWMFSFTGLPAGVTTLRLTFVGGKTKGVGFGFSDFGVIFAGLRSLSVPEPGSLVLVGLGSLSLLVCTVRRSRRRSV
jgi:hypothetical protein